MTVESQLHQRRFPRIHGPFDAWRVGAVRTPVRIIDLGLGGCFLTAAPRNTDPDAFAMSIDLGQEGVVEVQAAAIYHRPHGSAVTFDNLTADARDRIARTVGTAVNKLSAPGDGVNRQGGPTGSSAV